MKMFIYKKDKNFNINQTSYEKKTKNNISLY